MKQIARISYTHEAFINWLIENPHKPLRDAAEYFGYSQTWLSQILHSDIFQEMLSKRQALVAAIVLHDLPSKMRGVADVALDKLAQKIEKSEDPEFLLNATDKLLHRMGFAPSSPRNPGAINVSNQTVNNTFVVDAGQLASARQKLLSSGEQIPASVEQPEEMEVLPLEHKP